MLSEVAKTRIEHFIDARSVNFGAWLYPRTGGGRSPGSGGVAPGPCVLTTTGRRTGLPRTVLVPFWPDVQARVTGVANPQAARRLAGLSLPATTTPMPLALSLEQW